MEPKKLGIFTGKLLSASWRARNINAPPEEKESLERTLSSALKWFLPNIPQMPDLASREEFYHGMARGMSESRISFSELVGFFPSLPGSPGFVETWNTSRDDFQAGKVFLDRFRNRTFLATNENGVLLIQCFVEYFRQQREKRESNNQSPTQRPQDNEQ